MALREISLRCDPSVETSASEIASYSPRLSHRANNVGVEGAEKLATALQQNTTLAWLDLSHNSIGDEGAEKLAAALETNATLSWLYVSCVRRLVRVVDPPLAGATTSATGVS